ncbi:hypothetical protein LJC42_02495 [Eubacteriales bacterium OttesenSCG-928-K08]|nr:hypothetical protein [Eubacteriales bacterium OttesenSCG-928-K08]
MKNRTKNQLKMALAALTVLTLVFVQGGSVLAATTGNRKNADPGKEEVVYVTLDTAGNVDTIYVVNQFVLESDGGTITDYGNYSDIKNLSTLDEIGYENDTVTIRTDASSIYYQGVLSGAQLPWTIKISYFIDGQEYEASELAGKSGKLEIKLDITGNPQADVNFYDGCALQVSLALNAADCKNIEAPGATIANAGKNKQIAYTALPGRGLQASITADVKNFEMDGISISGVKFVLDMDIDTAELSDSFSELTDGVSELNDGASELQDGVNELYKGAKELYDGVSEFADGVSEFDEGVSDLRDGVKEFADGVLEMKDGGHELLNGFDKLYVNSYSMAGGSAQILEGLQLMAKQLDNQDTSDIVLLAQGSALVRSGLEGMAGGISQLDAGLDALQASTLAQQNAAAATQLSAMPGMEGIVALLQGNAQAFGAIDQMQAGLKNPDQGLVSGSAALAAQYKQIDDAIQFMATDENGLINGLNSLAGGLDTFARQYKKFDSGLKEYMEGLREAIDGYGELYDGMGDLADGAYELYDGVVELNDGSHELKDGAWDLADGVKKFKEGVFELSDGTTQYADGMQTFQDETSNIDERIDEEITKLMDDFTGSNVVLGSFTSPKNENVTSVQFVMSTPAIKIEKPDSSGEDMEQNLTVWDRFLNLFR